MYLRTGKRTTTGNAAACFDEARRLHQCRDGDSVNDAVSAILWLGRGIRFLNDELTDPSELTYLGEFPWFSFRCLEAEQLDAAMSGAPSMGLDWIMREGGHFGRVLDALSGMRPSWHGSVLIDGQERYPIHVENPYADASVSRAS